MRYLMLLVATVVGMVACGKKNDSVATGQNGCSNGICAPGQYGYAAGYGVGVQNRVGGSLTAVGVQAFSQLLGENSNYCTNSGWTNWPGQLNFYASFGSWNCKSYTQRGYVNIRFDQSGTRAFITVGAGVSYGRSPYEVRFDGRVYPINNSAGMEIRGFGQQGSGGWSAQYNNGIVITIQQGSPSTLLMTGEVTYRGRKIGDVQLYRF